MKIKEILSVVVLLGIVLAMPSLLLGDSVHAAENKDVSGELRKLYVTHNVNQFHTIGKSLSATKKPGKQAAITKPFKPTTAAEPAFFPSLGFKNTGIF